MTTQEGPTSPHILFAEDEEALRMIVPDELSDAGFTIDAVADGSCAIACLKENVYDLVLLDIRMPNKSGSDVLEFMQSEHIQTRTIMVTGVADMSIAVHTLELGASAILTKPFSTPPISSEVSTRSWKHEACGLCADRKAAHDADCALGTSYPCTWSLDGVSV